MTQAPIGNKVRIQPDEAVKTTPGGIIVPTGKVPDTGTVLAVSEDYTMSVAKGDRVQYAPNGREELEDGTILLSEDNIYHVFN